MEEIRQVLTQTGECADVQAASLEIPAVAPSQLVEVFHAEPLVAGSLTTTINAFGHPCLISVSRGEDSLSIMRRAIAKYMAPAAEYQRWHMCLVEKGGYRGQFAENDTWSFGGAVP